MVRVALLLGALGMAAVTASVANADTLHVEIEGLDAELRDNVLALLDAAREQASRDLTGDRIQLLHRQAEAEIRSALEPFGYYRPSIDKTLTHEGDAWRARYDIVPGPRMPIGQLELSITGDGANDSAFAAWRAKLPLAVGSALLHARYEETKRALSRLAADRGYFDARFTRNEIRVDLDRYTAAVFLDFDTGPRYRFGPVEFKVEGNLSPDWLSRYVGFEDGEPFDAASIADLQRDLFGTDYFSTVDIQPMPARARNGRVPIEVTMVQRKRDRYTTGVGYGTDTGARGTLGWERRYIGDRGQKFTSKLKVSQVRAGVSTQYTIPVYRPATDRIAFTANWTHDYPDTSDSRTLETGSSLTRGFGNWLLTGSLNVHRERFEVANDRGETTLLIPGTSALLVRTDDRIVARRGYRWQLDLRGASEDVVSDLSFLQGRAQLKVIQALGARGRLIARTDGGATRTDDFEDLPATLRFFAGGDNSVRGYAYQSIGPVNAEGEVTGGKYLLVGSIEYEHAVYKKWSAAVFYDVGNAFLGAGEAFKAGTGIGVRWRSPLGNIRLDVANAVSEPDRPWRIHFTLGPDF